MHKKIDIIIAAVLVIGSFYLIAHMLISYGAIKEREEKECVSASAIKNWEETLNIAKEICVNSQDNQLKEIRISYEKQIEKLEDDAKYWRQSYIWLKKQGEIIN